MRIYRAAWVLPVSSPPVRDGWVAIDGHHVAGCGPAAIAPPEIDLSTAIDLDGQAVMPGLVNAHTHLELSYMRGLVPPTRSFDAWVRTLVSLRGKYPDPFAAEIVSAAHHAIGEARAAGTGLVGDISNTLITVPMLRDLGMSAHVFHEVLGFRVPDPVALVRGARQRIDALGDPGPGVRAGVTPHAPYSVSPELFGAIADDLAWHPADPCSVHLGESPEEVEFLSSGGGAIRRALEGMGAWNPAWTPPACGPLEYLCRFGLLTKRLLAVHGVQLTDGELAGLASAGATLVTCPRSNRWTGVGDPPIGRFYASGVRVAIGTDSLASVDDLNLFSEMAAIRRLGPGVPARKIIESATRGGAAALGFDAALGTIETGKRAELISVAVPAGVSDVEEYLVSGVQPSDLGWLRPRGPANP